MRQIGSGYTFGDASHRKLACGADGGRIQHLGIATRRLIVMQACGKKHQLSRVVQRIVGAMTITESGGLQLHCQLFNQFFNLHRHR